MADLLEMHRVTPEYLMLKFENPVSTATLKNDNFVVWNTSAATPYAILNPFKPIVLASDYISVSRTLYLYWNFDLQLTDDYQVVISGLNDPWGNSIPSDNFTIDGDKLPAAPVKPTRPTDQVPPEDIEDWTIKVPPPLVQTPPGTETPDNDFGDFRVVTVTPDLNESYQLSGEDYEGKIVVEFSTSPAANFLDADNFKLQKRPIAGVGKWVNVATMIAAESDQPKVNIYLPSTDADPKYSYQTTESATYWEDGYKYRLILSKSIGV